MVLPYPSANTYSNQAGNKTYVSVVSEPSIGIPKKCIVEKSRKKKYCCLNCKFYIHLYVSPMLVCMFLFSIDVLGVSLRVYRSSSSTSSSAGRLEMYYFNQWTPFTIVGFDMHEADLACKALGYSYASRYARVGYWRCVSDNNNTVAVVSNLNVMLTMAE